jgi:hypothetical protein
MIGQHSKFRSLFQGVTMILTATLLMSSAATAAEKAEPPQTTTEGLKLVTNTKTRLSYVADDVDFGIYNKVYIVDCAVAFAKNWQRDYNRNVRELSSKVQDRDVERMKESLAARFKKVFTETMADSGVEVVTEIGDGVLVLRPAIINLVVNSPDLRTASRSRSYTANAGQMTLYLEVYDAVSGAKLAEVMDAAGARQNAPVVTHSNSATNIQAADRILKKWATELAGHFGAVKMHDTTDDETEEASD